MDAKHNETTKQPVSGEAERYRASARAHLRELKEFWITFAATSAVIIVILAAAIRGGFGWFASNSQVNGEGIEISYAGQSDFALATVGSKDQGVYDGLFGLTAHLASETIGGTTYYIGAGNSSLRLNSDKNLNNYLANADLRPGNRGYFDLYVICRSDNREVVLRPVYTAWYEVNPAIPSYQNAFSPDAPEAKRAAATFLTGHFLLFANMDEKGMYSGNIDFTKEITVNLANHTARQGEREFAWGEPVYSEGNTAVYRLSVYWVWPEQFGNFVYTGNSYNKNLFADTASADYKALLLAMIDETAYRRFFPNRPENPINNTITTQDYELYSGWYNGADEAIGTEISYLELGFEIAGTDE